MAPPAARLLRQLCSEDQWPAQCSFRCALAGCLQNHDLPAVSFIKPLGSNNEHPGYADLLQGQQHVADIVEAVRTSPYWGHTLIIVTYDEHGGRWDHISPPTNNGVWGDGSRVPAIVIGQFAKTHFVDHTQHDKRASDWLRLVRMTSTLHRSTAA